MRGSGITQGKDTKGLQDQQPAPVSTKILEEILHFGIQDSLDSVQNRKCIIVYIHVRTTEGLLLGHSLQLPSVVRGFSVLYIGLPITILKTQQKEKKISERIGKPTNLNKIPQQTAAIQQIPTTNCCKSTEPHYKLLQNTKKA